MVPDRRSDLEESNRQLLGAWDAFAKGCPNSARQSGSGWDARFCGVQIPFFNIALVTSSISDSGELRACAEDAKAWANGHGVPWFLTVCRESVSSAGMDVEGAMRECGMHPAMSLTGMIADTLIPGRPVPANLEFQPVGNAGMRQAMIEINAAAYGMALSSDVGGDALASEAMWSGVHAVVGCADGMPVTCSGTFAVEGKRYVGWVATRPEYQRRGFAEAVMRRSLEDAASAMGPVRSVLHATDAGFPIYERMGYRTVAHYTLFMAAS